MSNSNFGPSGFDLLCSLRKNVGLVNVSSGFGFDIEFRFEA